MGELLEAAPVNTPGPDAPASGPGAPASASGLDASAANPFAPYLSWRPDAIVFDCDGLLLDTESVWDGTQQHILQRYNTTLSVEQNLAIMGTSVSDTARIIADAAGRPFDQVRADIVEQFDLDLHGNIHLMDGVVEFLELVHGTLPLAVASNSERDQLQMKLEESDLRRFFSAVVSAEDVQNEKPAPDMYEKAARDVGADPSRSLGFEDSPVGARAALAAGLTLIGIPSTEQQVTGAHVTIASLRDVNLLEWVSTW